MGSVEPNRPAILAQACLCRCLERADPLLACCRQRVAAGGGDGLRDVPGKRKADHGVDKGGENDLVNDDPCAVKDEFPHRTGGDQPAEAGEHNLAAELPRSGWPAAGLGVVEVIDVETAGDHRKQREGRFHSEADRGRHLLR